MQTFGKSSILIGFGISTQNTFPWLISLIRDRPFIWSPQSFVWVAHLIYPLYGEIYSKEDILAVQCVVFVVVRMKVVTCFRSFPARPPLGGEKPWERGWERAIDVTEVWQVVGSIPAIISSFSRVHHNITIFNNCGFWPLNLTCPFTPLSRVVLSKG